MDAKRASFSSNVGVHLKTIFFLSFWFAIPAVLLAFLASRPDLGVPAPQIYQAEMEEVSDVYQVPFMVRLKGVDAEAGDGHKIFVQLAEEVDPASPSTGSGQAPSTSSTPEDGQAGQAPFAQQAKIFTFEFVNVRQDENDPEVFRGRLLFDEPLEEVSWTIWVKGPLHLQRRFDGVVVGEELDFTDKALLPGDIILPDTGQDNKIDEIDRDYLWSLTAKDGVGLTEEEIKSADLNLDNKITDKDLFLLEETGVWTAGER